MIMNRLILSFVFLLVVMAGCKKDSQPNAAAETPTLKTFDVQGILRDLSPDHRIATIQHHSIPGFMPAMTMPFNVKVPQECDGIEIGSDITFKLVVSTNDHWIQDIHFLALRIENIPSSAFLPRNNVPELKPGDLLPDYEFTAEDGSKIHFSDFHGRPVAFTFFFTSCPLPDYCPRMSKNFFETRQLMLAMTNAPANWQLLSISFDPGFDTPEVLTGYANFYRGGDTNRWLFAVASTNTLAGIAPRLDLMVLPNSMGVTHNLRTVVLDPQGRIFREFDGNQWTPQELADAIVSAAQLLPK
jgi:protein SCO1/2